MHPILLKIGRLTLYSYGAMIALGFLAASWVAGRRARRIGLDPVKIQNVALAALIGGILGGRAAYVAMNWASYRSDWVEILRLDHGGLVFYGGFAGGLFAVLAITRRYRMPLGTTFDLLVPSLVLAHAFGRIGCFLNGCCYGKPSPVSWAVAFPEEGIPRHPTQLYEAAFLFLLFFVLSRIASSAPSGPPRNDVEGGVGPRNDVLAAARRSRSGKQSRFKPGTLLLVYGVVYGLWRFGVEFLRGDNPAAWRGLTIFQLASLVLIAVSAGALLRKRAVRSW